MLNLIIIRKLLRVMHVSNALANVVLLAFALTPIVTVLSAQINYDNLLILSVSLCVYEIILFIKLPYFYARKGNCIQRGKFTFQVFVIACNGNHGGIVSGEFKWRNVHFPTEPTRST